ncbi:hypothetical protein HPP92_009040 [Vanilla planifolia]|uniref:Uncharacterized protein n=1 Tax=Vanilla planifolia TaxID=51239 RepID=A0A835RF45_VANPL|nr:hypothetical protein HPP92_009040 [Vanilla planifolia]
MAPTRACQTGVPKPPSDAEHRRCPSLLKASNTPSLLSAPSRRSRQLLPIAPPVNYTSAPSSSFLAFC